MNIPFFLPILIFILGASIGSFLSVVIHRIHTQEKGIFFGHSICPQCRLKLSFFDMVPVISYLVLKGRCRKCKTAISPHYLFLELAGGLLFLSIFLMHPFLQIAQTGQTTFFPQLLTPFIFETLYGVFFLGILFYDLKTKTIPDLFLFPLIVLAAVGTLLTGQNLVDHLLLAPLMAAIFFGGQILVSKGKWLGEGDLYLGLALGIILGWQLLIVAVMASYVIGSIVAIPLLLSKKTGLKSAVPFGPFLITGALVALFVGETIIALYLSTLYW